MDTGSISKLSAKLGSQSRGQLLPLNIIVMVACTIRQVTVVWFGAIFTTTQWIKENLSFI